MAATETERDFVCPHCWERGSVLVDLSVEGAQHFVQDCEVCCGPIEFAFTVERGGVREFSATAPDR